MNPHHLSEDDFKVEGHCCAVTFPAIKQLENGIDCQADEAVKAYLAEHYEMVLATPKVQKTEAQAMLTPNHGR